jgi:hypothetical protein
MVKIGNPMAEKNGRHSRGKLQIMRGQNKKIEIFYFGFPFGVCTLAGSDGSLILLDADSYISA